MFLSAEHIKQAVATGELAITPFVEENVKPASYTFTLDSTLHDPVSNQEIVMADGGYVLPPGGFVLGKTAESLDLRGAFVCLLGTRGSTAQKGIDALQTSTIAEPDTNGQMKLEITNRGSQPVTLTAGMPMVKGVFGRLEI
jgi:deoxycytidine triphosphate deaminase